MKRSPSEPDDRTSRARIRDAALHLFAERGAEGVTVRQIAAAAKVSPALVVRHFGSKDGLRDEVDRHVLRAFDAMLAEVRAGNAQAPVDPAAMGSMAEAVVRHLPAGSPIPRYLGRLLLDRSKAGRALFKKVFGLGQATLGALVDAKLASPGAHPGARAAFLTANDLAVLLLREPLTEWLGVDPLSRAGITLWGGEVLDVYARGLGASPPKPSKPSRARPIRRKPPR